MPELAEVEYYRKQWDIGRNQRIVAVHVHAEKRIFRGIDLDLFRRTLQGATLLESKAHGKQMLFRFSKSAWIGVHLGMSGKLEGMKAVPGSKTSHTPGKHDHLVLQARDAILVYHDPRLFGRILFHIGKTAPLWWMRLPPAPLDAKFTAAYVEAFLRRHGGAPIKAVLLMQAGFPGIGNWMADEILWQSHIHPGRRARGLLPPEIKRLHRFTQAICRTSLRTVGVDYGDLPKRWLFDRRWKRGGHCPKDDAPLRHATIGGRTTCWCPKCQSDANG